MFEQSVSFCVDFCSTLFINPGLRRYVATQAKAVVHTQKQRIGSLWVYKFPRQVCFMSCGLVSSCLVFLSTCQFQSNSDRTEPLLHLNSWKVLKIWVGREGQISNTIWLASWWDCLFSVWIWQRICLSCLFWYLVGRDMHACGIRETTWGETCRRTVVIVRRACKINHSEESKITFTWNCGDGIKNLRNQFSDCG